MSRLQCVLFLTFVCLESRGFVNVKKGIFSFVAQYPQTNSNVKFKIFDCVDNCTILQNQN